MMIITKNTDAKPASAVSQSVKDLLSQPVNISGDDGQDFDDEDEDVGKFFLFHFVCFFFFATLLYSFFLTSPICIF